MTEQIDYDPNTVLEALNNKADRDLNNVTDGTYQVLTTKNVTNCITKIPQDIKLELNDGTLTLKAGSKVYDGAGNVINITSDITRSDFSVFDSSECLVFYSKSFGGLLACKVTECTSGATDSSSVQNHIWYDTTNKQIKFAGKSGTAYDFTDLSLPFCRCSITYGTGITSIGQVFNGFGYIGSTIFALPGVEGLIPNGRNIDGSLNNIKFTTNKVYISNLTGVNKNLSFSVHSAGWVNYGTYKVTKDNYLNSSFGEKIYDFVCGTFSTDSTGHITTFNPKTTLQILDRNDKEEIVSWGMPDLTAGVNLTSGTTIPVNSLVYVASTRSAGNLARAYLDGEEMFKNEGGASTSDGSGATFLAPENSIYTSSGNFDKQIYYPLKGEI